MNKLSKKAWNEFLRSCPMASVFQSSAWEYQMHHNGWYAEYFRWHQTGAVLYCKNIPLLGGTIMESPGGPVWNSVSDLSECLARIFHFAKGKNTLSIRLTPHCLTDERTGSELLPLLMTRGYHFVEENGGTYLIDLTQSETTLFNCCSKNHRRDIRKASRAGITFRFGGSVDDLIDLFYQFYLETFRRKKLRPHSSEFFLHGIKELVEDNHIQIFTAEYLGNVYNIALVSLFGRPTYSWGASRPTPHMPPMGEGLHWEIIRWLKAQGYSSYDLGGAPGPTPYQSDYNYGTWRFKAGFGGVYQTSLGAFELVLQPVKYWVFKKLLLAYRSLRKRAILF